MQEHDARNFQRLTIGDRCRCGPRQRAVTPIAREVRPVQSGESARVNHHREDAAAAHRAARAPAIEAPPGRAAAAMFGARRRLNRARGPPGSIRSRDRRVIDQSQKVAAVERGGVASPGGDRCHCECQTAAAARVPTPRDQRSQWRCRGPLRLIRQSGCRGAGFPQPAAIFPSPLLAWKMQRPHHWTTAVLKGG